MFERFFNRPFVIPVLIGSLSLIIGFWILGATIASRGSDSTIAVTGSASVNIKADSATWQINVQRTTGASGTTEAYGQVVRDGAVVRAYLESQKLASSTVSESVISTDENYQQNQNGPATYTVHESVTVQTSDVEGVDVLSRKLDSLTSKVGTGTLLMPQSPAYYVSSLPELRVSLAGKAVEDAKARAKEIAKSGGSSVGALKSASSGVVQVLAPNSTNVDDYGSYDTSTIQKQVMVTTRATFYVR
jgi:hypothetical protein